MVPYSGMRAIRVVSLLALILLCVTVLSAADVTGKWTGEMEGRNGKRQVTMNLKAEGATVTGTISGRNGDTPISDGKIDGDTITFNRTMQFGDNKMTMNYKGKIAGDEIKFAITAGERNMELTVKRVQ